jgi:hypothetical protein
MSQERLTGLATLSNESKISRTLDFKTTIEDFVRKVLGSLALL